MDRIALVAGILGAPIALAALGHHLRRRPPKVKRLFWGGVIGHTMGLFLTVGAMLFPSVSWVAGGPMRVHVVHWSLLVGLVLGLAVAAVSPPRAGSSPQRGRR